MTGGCVQGGVRGWWGFLFAVLSMLGAAPAWAHHQAPNDGPTLGLAIPAISHGAMPVVAKYRNQVLELASRQPVTDPTLRRLIGFVTLQRFTCFWGLVPGSLSDEESPFNECSHAYLAGVQSLLAHMTVMPGDQSAAKALEARMSAEIASDPNHGILCSNSSQTFDSGIVVGPDWQLAPAHVPTVLAFVAMLVAAGFLAAGSFRLLSMIPKEAGA